MRAPGPDAIIASQRQFKSPAQRQTRGQSDGCFAGILKHVEQIVPTGREIVDLWNGVGSNLVHKEFHVSASDKRFASPVQHNRVNRIVGIGGGNGFG